MRPKIRSSESDTKGLQAVTESMFPPPSSPPLSVNPPKPTPGVSASIDNVETSFGPGDQLLAEISSNCPVLASDAQGSEEGEIVEKIKLTGTDGKVAPTSSKPRAFNALVKKEAKNHGTMPLSNYSDGQTTAPSIKMAAAALVPSAVPEGRLFGKPVVMEPMHALSDLDVSTEPLVKGKQKDVPVTASEKHGHPDEIVRPGNEVENNQDAMDLETEPLINVLRRFPNILDPSVSETLVGIHPERLSAIELQGPLSDNREELGNFQPTGANANPVTGSTVGIGIGNRKVTNLSAGDGTNTRANGKSRKRYYPQSNSRTGNRYIPPAGQSKGEFRDKPYWQNNAWQRRNKKITYRKNGGKAPWGRNVSPHIKIEDTPPNQLAGNEQSFTDVLVALDSRLGSVGVQPKRRNRLFNAACNLIKNALLSRKGEANEQCEKKIDQLLQFPSFETVSGLDASRFDPHAGNRRSTSATVTKPGYSPKLIKLEDALEEARSSRLGMMPLATLAPYGFVRGELTSAYETSPRPFYQSRYDYNVGSQALQQSNLSHHHPAAPPPYNGSYSGSQMGYGQGGSFPPSYYHSSSAYGHSNTIPVTPTQDRAAQHMSYGTYVPGASYNGSSYNGPSYNRSSYNGPSYNGSSYNGPSYNGSSYNGPSYNEASYNGPSRDTARQDAVLSPPPETSSILRVDRSPESSGTNDFVF